MIGLAIAGLSLGGCGRQQAMSEKIVRPSVATEQTVRLEDLTWTELRDEVAHGKTTAIIPVGRGTCGGTAGHPN